MAPPCLRLRRACPESAAQPVSADPRPLDAAFKRRAFEVREVCASNNEKIPIAPHPTKAVFQPNLVSLSATFPKPFRLMLNDDEFNKEISAHLKDVDSGYCATVRQEWSSDCSFSRPPGRRFPKRATKNGTV